MSRLTAEPLRQALQASVQSIRERTTFEPEVAIILGTGLGALAREIQVETEIPYTDIANFPVSTVESHAGRLLLGTLQGRRVVTMQGRFHRYEGYALQQVVHPVRTMHLLGARTLIVSNVSGAMHPLWRPGDVMLLDDHINMLGDNPLIGPNLDELGPRFPDMSEPYDRELQALAEQVALEQHISLRRGVYAAVPGPSLETRAEYRMLRSLGADVVGMSTVPEVITARHSGMRVLGFSVITDMCLPDALAVTELETIICNAGLAEPKLAALVKGVLARLAAA
ncbi:MAG: purine-nucleoside phosphorylase [Longimicrobiales bacterium]